MAVEHKLSGPSMAQRVADRLKNSGAGAKPDVTVQTGNSARRTFHNIHNSGHPVAPGTAAKPTAGKVDVQNESRMGKGKQNWWMWWPKLNVVAQRYHQRLRSFDAPGEFVQYLDKLREIAEKGCSEVDANNFKKDVDDLVKITANELKAAAPLKRQWF
jgi:hypothetical protein